MTGFTLLKFIVNASLVNLKLSKPECLNGNCLFATEQGIQTVECEAKIEGGA